LRFHQAPTRREAAEAEDGEVEPGEGLGAHALEQLAADRDRDQETEAHNEARSTKVATVVFRVTCLAQADLENISI